MNELVWRYLINNVFSETLLTPIGCTVNTPSGNLEPHSNGNSLYVSYDGDDSETGADGTQESPYRTVIFALEQALLRTDIDVITILDSEEYYTGESGTETLDLAGIHLQGAVGQTPTLTIDTDIASQEYMIDLTFSSKIINCKIVVPDGYATQVTCIRAYSGTIKNCTIDGATRDGVVMPAASTAVTMQYNKIINCKNEGVTDGNGVRLDQGTLTIFRNLIADNDRAGIYCAGSAVKVIDGDYNTIAKNQYGIYGHAATNLSLTTTDSILYENSIYDYYNTAGDIQYSCVGSVNGSPNITGNYIRFNPFFVGNSDYRIRTLYNGYGDEFITSPAISVSSTGIDVGCYQMSRKEATGTYVEFFTERADSYRSALTPVDAKIYYSNTLRPKIIKKGDVNILSIGWDNMIDTEYANLKTVYENGYDVFLSIDNGVTFKKYIIDTTKGFDDNVPVPVIDQTMKRDVSLLLIEV